MKSRASGVVVGVVVLASQLAFAQRPAYRSGTDLVNLNVTVTGANQRHVSGLSSGQFEILEDGVPQTVQYFAAGETALDIVLVLDTSGSMHESLPLVQEAARRFVSALRPGDRVGVMSIADGLRIVQPLTEDMASVASAIVSTRARGETRLYTSLYIALTELAKTRGLETTPRRQAIVLLSDGRDTASAMSFSDLLVEVRRHGVPIYPIAPRQPRELRKLREAAFGESSSAQDFELRTIATDTGGRAFFPVTLGDLAGIYESIADELAHQYSLGYESTNHSNGGFRRIALRVHTPGVTWRTRTGYLADASAVAADFAPDER
jgi:Ca-activated chloride channel family protein